MSIFWGLVCASMVFYEAKSAVLPSGSKSAFNAPISVEPGGSLSINSYANMYPIILSNPGSVHIHMGPDHATVRSEAFRSEMLLKDSSATPSLLGTRSKWINSCEECWNTIMERLRPHLMKAPSLYAYIKENRWSLGIKSLVGIYIVFNYMLFRMVSFLTSPQRWMYWRSDLLLVQLMRMPSVDIIQDLLSTLSLRTSLSLDQKPFQVLFKELDDEIYQLQRYSNWVDGVLKLSQVQNHCASSVEWLIPSFLGIPVGSVARFAVNAVSLKNIIYIQEDIIRHSPEYLRRLMYLRRIVEEELAVELPQERVEGSKKA